MPLRRLLNTFSRTSCHPVAERDVVMSDATESTVSENTSPTALTPSRATNLSTSLGKRRHIEIQEEDVSQRTASTFSSTLPSSFIPSLPIDPSTSFSLTPIDTTHPISPGLSASHPMPPSPTPTEIASDVEQKEITAEDCVAALLAEGIKVRDFIYEPVPNSCKAPEFFDPLPSLIAADWHMRNPQKNHGLLSAKALFRLIKIGWLSVTDVAKRVHAQEFSALAQYSERPEEERYPFVVTPNESMPTPSQRVRMRHNAGFQSHPDDLPDREFFGYDPTGHSDEEHPLTPPEEEDEVGTAQAEEPKPKRRKVKAKAKPLRRAKPLQRENSCPEV
ncbi:hypothetical protein BGW80DRAFT_177052 [Lactifluus volemus]|nr:hypothetical protein BGW80DRAFT_177052 [Lactifluus volemus]